MLALADHNPTRHIRAPWVNWALIALCVTVYALGVPWQDFAFTPATLSLTGGTKAPGGTPEVIGQMASYIFLHASFLHLAGNMIVLWVFGDNIEDSMGPLRYALFFVLCGMAGAGAESLFSRNPMVPVIGASGAIAGVMGAYLLLHPRAQVLVLVGLRVPVTVPAGVFVGLSVVLDLIAALAEEPGQVSITFWAHIGGFAAGAVLLTVLRWRDVPLFQPPVPHPEAAFLGLSRWLPSLGDATTEGTGSARWWFWIKTAAFFILVSLVIESFLA
ncbi:rhomboid family intramembrane serine protease [Pararhodobacter zhoushanensis]|uniref:Rhomboid family intramembrane serine protease n=1 Tax=Pararhodobacter zhoushanensis TaxID=2479545 RepID=A0ABT3GT76_9RHOB|nr:rhomboid family intramembrane serine protease [Pararhodobacter zhoushanensis]MCW1930716.1 rhomboid family intramembrane serine protease [Pararhodobacter zhoushanensis]